MPNVVPKKSPRKSPVKSPSGVRFVSKKISKYVLDFRTVCIDLIMISYDYYSKQGFRRGMQSPDFKTPPSPTLHRKAKGY
jgi:hypothetical protein